MVQHNIHCPCAKLARQMARATSLLISHPAVQVHQPPAFATIAAIAAIAMPGFLCIDFARAGSPAIVTLVRKGISEFLAETLTRRAVEREGCRCTVGPVSTRTYHGCVIGSRC